MWFSSSCQSNKSVYEYTDVWINKSAPFKWRYRLMTVFSPRDKNLHDLLNLMIGNKSAWFPTSQNLSYRFIIAYLNVIQLWKESRATDQPTQMIYNLKDDPIPTWIYKATDEQYSLYL